MIADREARRIAAPILAVETETLDGARAELDDIAREYEIKRADTPQRAEEKASRAKQLMTAALVAYLLLRRRKGSEAGIEAARRNLERLGMARAMSATLGRAIAVPTARVTMALRTAADKLTTRLVRGALTRVPGAALRPTPTARPGVPSVRRVAPAAPYRATPGALRDSLKTYDGGLERIVQVETWEGANLELKRLDDVAMVLDPTLQREWVATLDKRTCPVCRSMDGKIATPSNPFDVEPPVHPYCRCVVLLTRG